MVLCSTADRESWGKKTALALELTLFGDPEKHLDEGWEPLDLAVAVPLGEDASFRSFTAPPTAQDGAEAFLDEALHTLLVVLMDAVLLEDGALLDWLEACASMIAGRHRLFLILRGDETKERWLRRAGRPGLGRIQPIDFSGLGESSERMDWLALRLIHEVLQLTARGSLRTDLYDRRPYCQLEVQWAESHGSPIVLVDARSGLVHAASCLPFETAPAIRIPDGNLMRIQNAALRVAARSQLFRRQIVALRDQGILPSQATVQVIAVSPGMDTILTACRAIELAAKPRYIFYPEPRLSRGRLEAAKALAATFEAQLMTPRELLLAKEAR